MDKPDKAKIRHLGKSKPVKRGDRDSLTKGKLRSENGHWFGEEAKKWYILICLSLIVSILLFPNILTRPKTYKLGDVADRDIKASQEFLVENYNLTEQNRQEAVKAVLFVYDFDPTATNLISRIREAFKRGREYLSESLFVPHDREDISSEAEKTAMSQPNESDVLKDSFFEILDISPQTGVFDVLFLSRFPSEVEETTIHLVSQVLKKGIVGNKMMLMNQSAKGITLHNILTEREIKVTDVDRFYDLKAAKDFVKALGKGQKRSTIPTELVDVSLNLAISLIKPNFTFNKRETEWRKDLARKSVTPFYFKVKKGEMLVREGERVKHEHIIKLTEQNKLLKRKEMISRVPAMAVLIGFLISALYLTGLMTGRASRNKTKDLLFNAIMLLAIFLLVMASNFVSEETARGFNYFTPRALLFAVPLASGAMLAAIFHGIGVAASFSLIISVLACLVVGGRVEFFMYFFISSLVAAHGVRHCRDRSVFIKTGLKVSAFNVLMALSIEALYGSFYTMEAIIAVAAAFIGGFLIAVIATGILPLIEMSFGYTTDIKLLELANMDQPLLRELMVQCPGTHHHSVIVSNMVEATAEAINANPLLAKVAAYYHDIGKMKKPLYFIENQGRENKHEKLAPSMSSLILISHIKDGVELAEKHKLGSEIIDIIRQHHGTSLISFFYEKAKEQSEKKGEKALQIKDEDFRYPGPKPQTKEAGLVMLADVVAAASKTLVDPTAARIQGMVQKIINKIFSDGQLDECELTLKDLNEIAKSFNKTLSGIFHHRIDYPEPVVKTAQGKKGENGDTYQFPTEDSKGKKPDDKTKAHESLKRLGLS
ncbi:MAG: HDIG domain-containing protein [Deltaproteobacteria bacterium]|nr:HDIG domain-containing protein [Deltaproteobacteria bacterium]